MSLINEWATNYRRHEEQNLKNFYRFPPNKESTKNNNRLLNEIPIRIKTALTRQCPVSLQFQAVIGYTSYRFHCEVPKIHTKFPTNVYSVSPCWSRMFCWKIYCKSFPTRIPRMKRWWHWTYCSGSLRFDWRAIVRPYRMVLRSRAATMWRTCTYSKLNVWQHVKATCRICCVVAS